MLARVTTFAIDGLEPRAVTVEADIRSGLPAFTIVGLADRAVSEARERVRAALLNSGFEFPLRRVTVNLAPASLRKAGPGFDLAIACAVLAASGQISPEPLAGHGVFGELSLGGEIRPCRGVLAAAEGARQAGLTAVLVARERMGEAGLVPGIAVAGIDRLARLPAVLAGERLTPPSAPDVAPDAPATAADLLDLADVRGQALAIEALAVAAAGGHSLLLEGPPGTGKTMLARRLPSILPPLEPQEALEVTRIASIAGLHEGHGLATRRPFRAPHHTISAAGLIGGGPVPAPGEATLAHRGVLFLDELSEFDRRALESLRQPLEDGHVTVVRANRSARFPARFALIAATNPCPCGRAASSCRCGEAELARHRRRLSGPLMDRIDLHASVGRPLLDDLVGSATTSSAEVRDRVVAARERQRARGRQANAELRGAALERALQLTSAAERLFARAYDADGLSARGRDRALRVARTVADLDGSDRVDREHVAAALAHRRRDAEALA